MKMSIFGALVIQLLAFPCLADVRLDMDGCVAYAVWTHDILWARDVGADKAKVRTSLVDYESQTENVLFELLLRDFEALWTTAVPRADLAQAVARDCARRGGVYGPEV